MKNKSNFITRFFWIGSLIFLMGLGIFYYTIRTSIHQRNALPQMCTEKTCFSLEVARTQEEHNHGLMDRDTMAETHGMVFIFSQSNIYPFWMKNTRIPLDMLWIDENYKVVRILTAQPCKADPCGTYNPETFAKYVVEINAGRAEKYGIHEGSTIKLNNIK